MDEWCASDTRSKDSKDSKDSSSGIGLGRWGLSFLREQSISHCSLSSVIGVAVVCLTAKEKMTI